MSGRTEVALDVRLPYAHGPVLALLARHAVPGVERTDLAAGTHERLVPTPSGPVSVVVRPAADGVRASIASTDPGIVSDVVAVLRRWLDLDADPAVAEAALADDPVLGPLVAARPGVRVIGYPDPFEGAVMTVLGQQVSIAAARTFGGRLVAAHGVPGPDALARFPSPATLAALDPVELQRTVRVTHGRARTLLALAAACADGLELDPAGDHAAIRARLLAVSGVGPWTAEYLAVRVLGDPDAFPAGDLVLRRALGGVTTAEARRLAAAWAPHRALATFVLWTSATDGCDRRAVRPGA